MQFTATLAILSTILKLTTRCQASDDEYFDDIENEENCMINDTIPSLTLDESSKFVDTKETGARYYKKYANLIINKIPNLINFQIIHSFGN